MSSTTDILFNSPALHSLKRDQLVKLCKSHSIKANGKNVELVQRLRDYAQTLPHDAPLSIAARSENLDGMDIDDNDPRARNSEQWEMVMDSIQEMDESMSSLGTRTGEFGTHGSKSTTVGSSIKALATSLGLKRTNTMASHSRTASKSEEDELVLNSTPYNSLPITSSPPQTDHFTLNTGRSSLGDSPLPGLALRPGAPGPDNARLSMELAAPSVRNQATTTVRLISNPLPTDALVSAAGPGQSGTPQLKPFPTAFDIHLSTPMAQPSFGFNHTPSIYPKLTLDDMPAMPSPTPQRRPAPVQTLTPLPQPFVFGSPENHVSNTQFSSAAASVLEEMNKRLREEGVEELSGDVINNLHPSSAAGVSSREIKPLPGSAKKNNETVQKFNKLHQKEAAKMEGIDAFVRRRAQQQAQTEMAAIGTKRKSSVFEADKKRPSVVPKQRVASNTSTRVVSASRRAIPGSFDVNDDDHNEDDSLAEAEKERSGKRVKVDPEAPPTVTGEDEEKKKEDERESNRRKLEAARNRRRSSLAQARQGGVRTSAVKPRVSAGKATKLMKPSRFGIMAAAKSIVSSVLNRGKVVTPTNAPMPAEPPKAPPPPRKPPVPLARPPSSTGTSQPPVRPPSSTGLKPESTNRKPLANSKTATISSSRVRSPLPTFDNPVTRSGTVRLSATASSGSTTSGGPARPPSATLPTRSSATGGSAATTSLGARRIGVAPKPPSTGGPPSRLFAPTASSLAKMNSAKAEGLMSPTSIETSSKPLLGAITNGTPSALNKKTKLIGKSPLPTPSKIFSKPLVANPASAPPTIEVTSPSPKYDGPSELGVGGGSATGTVSSMGSTGSSLRRTGTATGRKPRISRSKVIAKLASQRQQTQGAAASSSTLPSAPALGLAPGAPAAAAVPPSTPTRAKLLPSRKSTAGSTLRPKSGIGAVRPRATFAASGGVKSIGGESAVRLAVLDSAKKRVRQSELARRKSHATGHGA